MAVTVTNVLAGAYTRIDNITATADADTTATITHGLGTTPLLVTGCLLLSQAAAAQSFWAATTINATQVVWTKLTTAGTGAAGAQWKSIISTPNSLTT